MAAAMSDPDNKLTMFLAQNDGSRYVTDPTFFWSQPLSDRGYAALLNRTESHTTTASAIGATGTSGKKGSGSSKQGTDGGESGAIAQVEFSGLLGVAGAALVIHILLLL